jgi:hypothetical protein
MWATTIVMNLNGKVLSKEYESEQQIHISSQVEVDVATMERDDPPSLFDSNGVHDEGGGVATLPQVYAPPAPPLTAAVELDDPDSFEVFVYRDSGRWKLAAAIELVSPANKDREAKRRAFATKCAAYLAKGVSVVVIDIITSRSANLHAELVAHAGLPSALGWESPTGLSVVCYRTTRNRDRVRMDVWPSPLTLGQPLPTVPLWLEADLCVPLELELTYHQACQSLRLA